MRLPLALLALALLSACSEAPPPSAPPRAVLVQSAPSEAVETTRVYAGDVRARHESDLAFRVGGKLVERRVDAGSRVRAGEVLMRIDPQDVELAAAAARAQRAAAEADLALAVAELRRGAELREAGFISESALDARRTAKEAAEARLRQARAQAAAAANQAEYSTLRADHDGIVLEIGAEVGQVLAAGQPALRLARHGEREVQIHVPESRIREVSPGQAAMVRPWSDARQGFAATVREVAPAADPATRTYAVRVRVADAADALPLGATAHVVFPSRTNSERLLPLTAVTAIDGRSVVWVVDAQSRVTPVEVEVRGLREDGVLVGAGLDPGARIVIAGVHRLVPGETVRAVTDRAPVALDLSR